MNIELEGMLKEVVVDFFEVWPGISLEGLDNAKSG